MEPLLSDARVASRDSVGLKSSCSVGGHVPVGLLPQLCSEGAVMRISIQHTPKKIRKTPKYYLGKYPEAKLCHSGLDTPGLQLRFQKAQYTPSLNSCSLDQSLA